MVGWIIMSKNAIEELKILVNEAEVLLQEQGEFFTEGNKIALLDLVSHAKEVLYGTYKVPFVRNREFYEPREDEDILFATKRYTMTPSYFMHEYGLKPVLEWFKKQHIMNEEKMKLKEKKNYVTQKANELLINSKKSDSVGCLRSDDVKELQQSVSILEGLGGEALGKAIIKVYNAIRKARYSKVLLSDVDKHSNLYFSESDFEQFKNKVLDDSLLSEEYDTIQKIADRNTLKDIEYSMLFMQKKINYNEVNKHFYVWSTTDKIINFTTPKNAAFANITFVLPSSENEKEGLGHVWIDNVKIFPAKGIDWNVINAGFEDGKELPDYWRPIVLKGSPEFKWEDEKPFCGQEGHSIYINNNTASDEGAWKYTEDIPVEEDVNNTITFLAKLDGKFKKGLKILIEFKDKTGNKVGEFTSYFNRKSCYATGNYDLTMQADAIVYAFTEDVTYAKKVKQQMMFILNDFCQGIEHWLVRDSRPQGSDAYGAVQGGRILCSLMSAYTLVKESDVFEKEDMDVIILQLEYFVRYLLDLRDRTELTEYDSQADATNWQTDMAAGTGMLMMAMPDFPNARQWLENANMVLRSQLKLNVNKDGSWPESIRYHFAALERFLIYSKALLNCTGENWISDGPIAQMFKYAISMQTPPYEFLDNHIATVNFGDHVIDGGGSFVCAGIYCDDISKFDEELGALMYETWIKAGKPVGKYGGEAVALENLFMPCNNFSNNKGYKLDLKSCSDFKDSGINLFRKDYGKTNESLFAIMASPRKIGHGHYDEGSFMIFKNCKPIVVDLGIEGYFDSSKDWYISSSAHNVVQFSRKEGKTEAQEFVNSLEISGYSKQQGWNDTPRTCELLGFSTSKEIDSITIKIANPEGNGYHIRKVDFYREVEVYVIHDDIYEFEGKVRFNLNIAATESVIKDNRILSKGHFGVDLETVFLGKKPELSLEWGRTKPMFPAVDEKNIVSILRAESTGKDGFLTVLYPKLAGRAELQIRINDGKYIIKTLDGKQVTI